jgi:pimeloyl-ACP methyl ester carboxylesterase
MGETPSQLTLDNPSLKPFEQLAFSAVPALPRLPHTFAQTKVETLSLQSRPFGPVHIHLHTQGRGPPLLLVHGFMTTSYSWRYVMGALAEHYTVYAPDLVGSGKSSQPDADYSPDNLAESIGEIIAALGLRGTAVIGNSLGGHLCMRLAMRDPSAIARLVNLHSPGIATWRNYALSAALALTPKADTLIRAMVWRNPERWVHKNVHYYDESLKSREEHAVYADALRSPQGVRAFYRMLQETFAVGEMRAFVRQLTALGGRFPIPLQLVYAKADPTVPPSIGRKLHALLPSASYVELERGSHFAHVDAPELFLSSVLPFLSAH